MLPWLAQLLQTSDSMFPTGAYAHSFGLEGAVQENFVTDPDSLRRFLNDIVVPSLQQLELPTVTHAWRLTVERNVKALTQLNQQYAALKTSREIRDASARIGSQRFELLRQIAPHPFLNELHTAHATGSLHLHEMLVTGIQGALGEIPLGATLTAACYQTFAVQTSAAMKLIRIGQLACQQLITGLMKRTPAMIAAATRIPIDRIGAFTPGLDIASARHETAYTRLFIS